MTSLHAGAFSDECLRCSGNETGFTRHRYTEGYRDKYIVINKSKHSPFRCVPFRNRHVCIRVTAQETQACISVGISALHPDRNKFRHRVVHSVDSLHCVADRSTVYQTPVFSKCGK